MDLNAHIAIPDYVLFRELDGEAVILNLNSEAYFGLDDVGTSMWQALEQSETIELACLRLMEEYDVQPDVLRQDMVALVQDLVKNGLLIVDNP